jgi:hypothetical protein
MRDRALITSGAAGAVLARLAVEPLFGHDRLCRLTKAARGQALRLPLISE